MFHIPKILNGFKLEMDLGAENYQSFKDHTDLINNGKRVLLCWMPSHVYISWIVVVAAESALCFLPITSMKLPARDLEEWQDISNNCAGDKLHAIHPTVGSARHSITISRWRSSWSGNCNQTFDSVIYSSLLSPNTFVYFDLPLLLVSTYLLYFILLFSNVYVFISYCWMLLKWVLFVFFLFVCKATTNQHVDHTNFHFSNEAYVQTCFLANIGFFERLTWTCQQSKYDFCNQRCVWLAFTFYSSVYIHTLDYYFL